MWLNLSREPEENVELTHKEQIQPHENAATVRALEKSSVSGACVSSPPLLSSPPPSPLIQLQYPRCKFRKSKSSTLLTHEAHPMYRTMTLCTAHFDRPLNFDDRHRHPGG